MTYEFSAKNGVPALHIGGIDIVNVLGIDWNWLTLPKITDSAVRSFFERLRQALCSIEISQEEESDCDNECEQDMAVRSRLLQIEMSVPTASVDWDESLWLYIYEHIGLWKSYIRGRIRFHTDILHLLRTDDGVDKLFSIIRTATNPADAEKTICETFAIASNTAREILDRRMRELVSLSSRSCSAQLAYWTEIEKVFTRLND